MNDELATLTKKEISYHTKAVGVTFEGRQEVLATLKEDTPLRLVREPENEYDPNAIAIEAEVGEWKPVGYIAMLKNQTLANEMDAGTTVRCKLASVTGGEDKNLGLNIFIQYKPTSLNLKRLIPDIGEGYVMYDETNHVYYDEQGKQMISGSLFEAENKPAVNLFFPAKATAKAVNCKPNDVTDLWNLHGELASDYGTLIHKGLQTYFNNYELMRKIDQNKGRSHVASNFMPVAIGKIVDSYLAEHDTDLVRRVKPELFVRAGNRCGFIDLLEDNNGTYTIHDYKFIKELKAIKYKVYGTLNNYTLQQNFYREILEANNLKVNKMVLDVYIGGEWKEAPVENVTLIEKPEPKVIGNDDGEWGEV